MEQNNFGRAARHMGRWIRHTKCWAVALLAAAMLLATLPLGALAQGQTTLSLDLKGVTPSGVDSWLSLSLTGRFDVFVGGENIGRITANPTAEALAGGAADTLVITDPTATEAILTPVAEDFSDGFLCEGEITVPIAQGEANRKTVFAYARRGLYRVRNTLADGTPAGGAEFAVLDTNGTVVASFVTDADGGYTAQQPLDNGTYQLVQMRAPEGALLLTNPLPLTVDTFFGTQESMATVSVQNESAPLYNAMTGTPVLAGGSFTRQNGAFVTDIMLDGLCNGSNDVALSNYSVTLAPATLRSDGGKQSIGSNILSVSSVRVQGGHATRVAVQALDAQGTPVGSPVWGNIGDVLALQEAAGAVVSYYNAQGDATLPAGFVAGTLQAQLRYTPAATVPETRVPASVDWTAAVQYTFTYPGADGISQVQGASMIPEAKLALTIPDGRITVQAVANAATLENGTQTVVVESMQEPLDEAIPAVVICLPEGARTDTQMLAAGLSLLRTKTADQVMVQPDAWLAGNISIPILAGDVQAITMLVPDPRTLPPTAEQPEGNLLRSDTHEANALLDAVFGVRGGSYARYDLSVQGGVATGKNADALVLQVQGTVREQSGQVAAQDAGLGVLLTGENGTVYGAQTDAQGSFALYGDAGTTQGRLLATLPENVMSVATQATEQEVWQELALPQTDMHIVYAQLSGVAGTVMDEAGEPIAGASLSLTQQGAAVRSATVDASGAYALHAMAAGEYMLTLSLPAGQNAAITRPEGMARQADGSYALADVSLTYGQTLTVDVTAKLLGALGGTVSEANAPVANVTLTLTDAAGKAATITTDATGKYAFTNLPGGSYTLAVDVPSGRAATLGADESTRSIGMLSQDFTVRAGETIQADIAMEATATLQGKIAELGAGQSIAAASLTAQLAATTQADGSFTFEGLAEGDYTVYAPLPQGKALLGDSPWRISEKGDTIWQTVHVAAGETRTLPAVEYIAMTSIEGIAFLDDDGDLALTQGEQLMSGVPVALQRMEGGAWTDVANTLSDAYGKYSFQTLDAGDYRVVSQAAGGLGVAAIGGDATPLGDAAQGVVAGGSISVRNGDALTDVADIALARPATLRMAAFFDSNENGTRGEYERAVSGVRVAVVPAAAPDGAAVAEATTAADGSALLENIPAGVYVIRVTLPQGYLFTVKGGGFALTSSCVADEGGSMALSDAITLQGGQTADAGVGAIPVGSFAGTVWNDANYNGVLDEGETGVAGVSLKLKGTKTGAVYDLTTDESGAYRFAQLRNDTYVFTADLPDGMLFTRYTQTGGDSRSVFTVDGSSAAREFIVTDAANVSQKNVGIVYGATLTGLAFLDANYNGIYDEGEPPYANVTLELIRNSNEKSMGKAVTDDTGRYTFEGLRPGSYRLRAILPNDGSIFTVVPAQGIGLFNQFVAREGRRENSIPEVAVSNGATVETCVGVAMGATISGVVSLDPKYDGVRGGADKKLSGVRVQLMDADGQIAATDTTNANGRYTLAGIMPGEYTVRVQRKQGHAFTRYRPDEEGGNHVKLLAKDGYGETETLTVAMGQEIKDIDAGMLPSSTLAGVFFDDVNDNGLRDEGEAGYTAGSVRLRSADGEIDLTEPVAADGAYFFDGVMPGTYTVTYLLPEHAALANVAEGGNTLAPQGRENVLEGLNVESGQAYTAPLVGAVTLGSFAGMAYHDVNGNGVQDADEPPMQGVRIRIGKSASDANAFAAETDGTGAFAIEGVRPGSYQLAITLPDGYILSADLAESGLTMPAAGSASIPIPWAALTNRAHNGIGLVKPATIRASVWLDENRDGAHSEQERLLSGLGYELYDEIRAQVVKTARAAEDGYVTFGDVRPSTYTVRFTIPMQAQPAGGEGTFVKQGARMVHTGIAVGEGETFAEIDGGLVSYTSIGGFVALDERGNRTPQPGVTVHLYEGDGVAPVQTATTDESGAYRFDGLWPDAYRIGVALPAGMIFVKPEDTNYAPGESAVVQTLQGIGYSDAINLEMADHQLDTDVVLIKPAIIGDQVWLDSNANGLMDADEPNLNGVTIQLMADGAAAYTTTADAWGYYEFADVYPGTYTLAAQAYPELTITQGVPALSIISSCLTAGDGNQATSDPFTVASGERNLDLNLGYVLREGEAMPAQVVPGAVQNWVK
ncbi:MAG: SdrD B-like domain-containing protein [Candidatus Limiplasma sp.]|nr:SdrD B-like domain-containing protein [Candidatus Limiplasma sp.]